jgi:hypothetical protein
MQAIETSTAPSHCIVSGYLLKMKQRPKMVTVSQTEFLIKLWHG